MIQPLRFKNESGISADNSKRFYRINETLEDLAALLVDEVYEDEFDNGQHTGLQTVTEDIWKDNKERLISWAERTEEARDARRQQMAEHVAPYVVEPKVPA